MAKNGNFFWYDLMTTDVPAAVKFYKAVVGWKDEAFPGSEMGYVVMKAGETGIGGIMPLQSPQQPPAWIGYIKSANVDSDVQEAVKLGGQLWKGPADIPGNVGRFAVLSDPTGAPYMLLKPNGPDGDGPAAMTPGTIGWNEYMGSDQQRAFTYYAKLYGWTQGAAMDMGEMGTYQLFQNHGVDQGGMMNNPPNQPGSYWVFYFTVDGIDAARQRVTDNGGALVMEPIEVPGGGWTMSAKDPQGAYFGLFSASK